MFPAVDPADVEALTACIDYVAERVVGNGEAANGEAANG
jgi:DNA-binding ferritin-like protein